MALQRLNYSFEWGTSLRAGELKRNKGVIFIQTYLMIRKEDDRRNKKKSQPKPLVGKNIFSSFTQSY